ncbi:uncharacterized protein BO96DRAFT_48422 [Aspergillus niger CBS 101883]|uniref:uncharacterized protein n=1 Tax=Aspergillus lacticoffeatus (strain CBS 101883) TaxID=1450533 RepID=UPI000D803666|nr:uncharacterized protein BO96DRAFT_48422 [Aspergillus niger CBS 101883]PYH56645.1 hypothetical protein BO96DRAFT_48422 [Aspergillus niger CBS 101883]
MESAPLSLQRLAFSFSLALTDLFSNLLHVRPIYYLLTDHYLHCCLSICLACLAPVKHVLLALNCLHLSLCLLLSLFFQRIHFSFPLQYVKKDLISVWLHCSAFIY